VKLSINSRMLIAASIILSGFLGVTGVILEGSFRASTEESFKERLQVHLNALIASADLQDDGTMRLIYALPEPRFFAEGSGLYAKILGNDGEIVWSSPSMQDMIIPIRAGLKRGERRYQYLATSAGEPVLAYMLGLTWGEQENENTKEGYTFAVAESLARFNQQLHEFRKNLWGALGAVTAFLLLMLTLILRWGLAPLREAAEDLRDIEAGRHLQLHGRYPKELRGLTDNLNALISTNREHEARYQASLGDLAHSLKTPLAVLRGAVELPNQSVTLLRSTVEEQVERMDQIVQYQLQRAAPSGRTALTAPVDLQAITRKVVKALVKVYADKDIDCRVHIDPGLEFHCQEGDMMELLGNLLDNAFKWGRARVAISIRRAVFDDETEDGLLLQISDDGPGIADHHLETVLTRGGRVDSQTSGHGLGLAMVQNIVALYHGRLQIGRAALGGAQVTVWLPWH
jgi:two-component system sensor histidine kinase PhoQ